MTMLKIMKRAWVPLLVVISWIAGNVLTASDHFSAEGVRIPTAKEMVIYATNTFGAATIVDYQTLAEGCCATLHDTALDFDYEISSYIQKTRNLLPYRLGYCNTFMSCYQRALISQIGADSLRTSEFPEHPDMCIVAESEDLAVEILKQLKKLDSRKLLGCISLKGPQGQGFGCYVTSQGKLKSQEEVDREYFTYKFTEIIGYPYTYEFIGVQDCLTSDIPGVKLQDIYAYYEHISNPVPTTARLYWFEFASGSRYYVADIKGLKGTGHYYTNFQTGGIK